MVCTFKNKTEGFANGTYTLQKSPNKLFHLKHLFFIFPQEKKD